LHFARQTDADHRLASRVPLRERTVVELICEGTRLPEFSSFEDFSRHALEIVDSAAKYGIPIRILGGAAIRIHCPQYKSLYEKMRRVPKHDMDFVTYSKFRPKTKEVFKRFGYVPYISLAMTGATGRNRQIFNDSEGNRAVDVFFDRLQMCHVIEFAGRLELDSPTVPLAELLLQKAQIVELNEKDIQDTIVLLRAYPPGDDDNSKINARQIARVLADDWGFCYTVTTNLRKVKDFLPQYGELDAEDKGKVIEAIDVLLGRIEQEPKTVKWKLRSKVGTSKRWYTVVEEVVR